MFEKLHQQKGTQLAIGFLIGVGFGFLLQKGWVTKYDIIIGQLLLTDFTVLKVIFTAIITGMIGVYAMKSLKLVELHPKPGAFGSTIIGGLIFGVGFAVLGYCPGTVSGAAAQGSLDALLGGIPGLFAGVWLYSILFPRLKNSVLPKGDFGKKTLPELLHANEWVVVAVVTAAVLGFFLILEKYDL